MNTTIQSLVEEALKKLAGSNLGETYTTNILTTLAEKASQNGLQPLPKAMPEWFVTYFNNRGNDAATCWSHMVVLFGTQPSEWWMGLKKGDKFLDYNGISRLYNGFVFLGTDRSGTHEARLCSPYTEPTKSFRDKLSPELQEEFDKEIAPLIKTP
jgi:hypothetical protein